MVNKTFTMTFTPKQLPYVSDALRYYKDTVSDSDVTIVANQNMVLTPELLQSLKEALKQYRLHIFNSSDEPIEDEAYELAMLNSLVVRIEAAEHGETL
jgi:hypothetical protein